MRPPCKRQACRSRSARCIATISAAASAAAGKAILSRYAVFAAKQMPGVPIKMIWSREDVTNGLGVTFFFGGTSLLIVVGVAMDTVNQVESQLIMRHYDGFMKKTRIRGRRG